MQLCVLEANRVNFACVSIQDLSDHPLKTTNYVCVNITYFSISTLWLTIFHLSGFANKQNFREKQKNLLHPSLVTELYDAACGVFGTYFCYSQREALYSCELEKFLSHQLEELGLEVKLLQQKSATMHSSRQTMAILKNMCPACLICRFSTA